MSDEQEDIRGMCTLNREVRGTRKYLTIGPGIFMVLRLLFARIVDVVTEGDTKVTLCHLLRCEGFYNFVYSSCKLHEYMTTEYQDVTVRYLFASPLLMQETTVTAYKKVIAVQQSIEEHRHTPGRPLGLWVALGWVQALAACQEDMYAGNGTVDMVVICGTAWKLLLGILHRYLDVQFARGDSAFVKTAIGCARAYMVVLLEVYNLSEDNYLRRMLLYGETAWKLQALEAASIANEGVYSCVAWIERLGDRGHVVKTCDWNNDMGVVGDWGEFAANRDTFGVPYLDSRLNLFGLLTCLAVAWCSISNPECASAFTTPFRSTLYDGIAAGPGDTYPCHWYIYGVIWDSVARTGVFVRSMLQRTRDPLEPGDVCLSALSYACYAIAHAWTNQVCAPDETKQLTVLLELPEDGEGWPGTAELLRKFLHDPRRQSLSIGALLEDELPYVCVQDIRWGEGPHDGLLERMEWDEQCWIAATCKPYVSALAAEVRKRCVTLIDSELPRVDKDRHRAVLRCLFQNWLYRSCKATNYLQVKVRELTWHKGTRGGIKVLAGLLKRKFEVDLLSAIDCKCAYSTTEWVTEVTELIRFLAGMIKDERLHVDGFPNGDVIERLTVMLREIAFFMKSATVMLINKPKTHNFRTIQDKGKGSNEVATQCLTPLVLHCSECFRELIASITNLSGHAGNSVLDNFMQVWYFLLLVNPCSSVTFFEEAREWQSSMAILRQSRGASKKRKSHNDPIDDIDDTDAMARGLMEQCTTMVECHRNLHPLDDSAHLAKQQQAIMDIGNKILDSSGNMNAGARKKQLALLETKVRKGLTEYLSEPAVRARDVFSRLAADSLPRYYVMKVVFSRASHGRAGALASTRVNDQQKGITQMEWLHEAIAAWHAQDNVRLLTACGTGKDDTEATRKSVCVWLQAKQFIGPDQTIYDAFRGTAVAAVALTGDTQRAQRMTEEVDAYLHSVVATKMGSGSQ